ncbi:MAG: AmmeMemoRadiSam system radical SAM enzyme [Gemmatimonadetes bacterium]|nr:AmmeMemoRadiSam system radical SAM enzyme [Gemmatimonadota bacterium]NIO33293.1 AmmeMemoRadiSam system radical SAM enzyme [Gemmatimonadota bacterium]
MATLAHKLDRRTRPGELCELRGFGSLRCTACALRCVIRPGRRGVCRVRFNDGGTLMVPWGYVVALQCDPTEKKPLFHVFPGSDAVTFGMLGCDLHCDYCQNWLTSQALRDEAAGVGPRDITADAIVELALRRQARLVVSSYNEPLITAEWAAEVFRVAKREGLHTACVSNGNATPEALDYLRPWTDAYKIDLKTMSDRGYRKLGCTLEHVLETVRYAHKRGFWLEIVTLVVPGFNDSEDELRDAASFIASVSTEIPWHVTAFHPHYKRKGDQGTSREKLMRAAEIGREAGLDFVYAGDYPATLEGWENTHCPACGRLLVERVGIHVTKDELSRNRGLCPGCGRSIPGIWPESAEAVTPAAPFRSSCG